jgi:hypothetical protein
MADTPLFPLSIAEIGDDPIEPHPDVRAPELSRLLRAVALVCGGFGLFDAVAGYAFAEPRLIVLALFLLAFSTWLAMVAVRPTDLRRPETIARIATVALTLIAITAVLDPSVAFAMAIAALVPAVLVLPFLGGRAVGRVLAIAGVVGVGSVVAGELLPRGEGLPAAFSSVIASLTLVLVYAFLLVFLWEVSRRLKSTADDLRSIVAMSNDLAGTMDPQLVGDRIARHIGVAVGATDCALSYWDRPADRLVTLGYFPLERRMALSAFWGQDPNASFFSNASIAPISSRPRPATIGGHPAQYVEVLIPSTLDFSRCDGRQFVLWDSGGSSVRYGLGPGEIDRLWVLEVHGTLVVIDAALPLLASRSDAAELQRVIDSVVVRT